MAERIKATLDPMRLPRQLLPYGPNAFLLNWEQRIDAAISAGVHAYARAVVHHPAVAEAVPAYASLLVTFRPEHCPAEAIREWLYALRPPDGELGTGLTHELPVYYDGPDLEAVARALALSSVRVIELHTATDYLVYQVGYQPGFAFLGQTDARLEVPRHTTPRARVPVGAVGLAGRQTGVYPTASPGGWQLIGRCPLPLLRDHSTDFSRLQAGDRVRFCAVDAAEYYRLAQTPTPWPER